MNTLRTLVGLGLAALLTGCLGSAPSGGGTMTGGGTGSGGGTTGGTTGGGTNGGTSGGGTTGGGTTGGSVGNELCRMDLTIAGTYTQGNAPPADFEPGSCWPDGMWTFTATVADSNCATNPPLEQQYQFQVVEDMDFNDTITYVNDPSNMYVATKISGGDGGVCVGAFLIFSADGKTVYNLRPAMQADNSLNGQGDVRVYDTDQRQ